MKWPCFQYTRLPYTLSPTKTWFKVRIKKYIILKKEAICCVSTCTIMDMLIKTHSCSEQTVWLISHHLMTHCGEKTSVNLILPKLKRFHWGKVWFLSLFSLWLFYVWVMTHMDELQSVRNVIKRHLTGTRFGTWFNSTCQVQWNWTHDAVNKLIILKSHIQSVRCALRDMSSEVQLLRHETWNEGENVRRRSRLRHGN